MLQDKLKKYRIVRLLVHLEDNNFFKDLTLDFVIKVKVDEVFLTRLQGQPFNLLVKLKQMLLKDYTTKHYFVDQ
jgi:hypothetical protein